MSLSGIFIFEILARACSVTLGVSMVVPRLTIWLVHSGDRINTRTPPSHIPTTLAFWLMVRVT